MNAASSLFSNMTYADDFTFAKQLDDWIYESVACTYINFSASPRYHRGCSPATTVYTMVCMQHGGTVDLPT